MWKMSLATAAAFMALAGSAQAQVSAPEMQVDREQLERRLIAVGTLIEKSTAARQIEASGDAKAIEKRERARRTYRDAHQAYASGNIALASRLLPEASVQMFEAVRLAAPERVTADKARADYNARLESVRSLLAAQTRISAEKGAPAGSAEATREIERTVGEAERLATSDIAAARATLDRAYLVAKAAIGTMRGGDTLVRTLSFASPADEYHYELDRNDTHRMLIDVLLKSKPVQAGAEAYIEKARALRTEAEALAARGDHAKAIGLLEDSTRELVRAIRGAGVFIPG